MASHALCFSAVYTVVVSSFHPGWGSSNVGACSHRFQMIGIHASLVSTEVVDVIAIWNRADQQSPSDPVGQDPSLPITPITIPIYPAPPIPTVADFDE